MRLADLTGDGFVDVLKGFGNDCLNPEQQTYISDGKGGWVNDTRWDSPLCSTSRTRVAGRG